MNATHTNRLAGLMNDRTAPRKPTVRRDASAPAAAPAHWLWRFLDLLMRTLAAPAF